MGKAGGQCLRWTQDTERAFVLALRQTGTVQAAAAAIGRQPGSCYKRRGRSPAFDAAWTEAVAELDRARRAPALTSSEEGGTALVPAPVALRTTGFTHQRRRQFLRALADTGRYGEAAARVGVHDGTVRLFRQRSPEFQALCDKALMEGGTTLEEAAYVRAVEGWEEPIVHGGKVIGHRRRFSDTLTRALLTKGAQKGGDGRRCEHGYATDEEVDRLLAERLDRLAAIEQARERQRQLDWADEMARRGWAP